MATKTANKKKTTTSKASSAKTSSVKASTAKKKDKVCVPGVFNERNPESASAQNKYKVFFVLFGITTVIFAAISVWLFIFSNEILQKWESLESCSRNGETCEVVIREEANDKAVEE